MPRSAIGMTEVEGDYYFDIEGYLIKRYPNITKPARRAICNWVRERIDAEVIEEMVDDIVLSYALDQQGWTPEDEDDENDD